MAKTIKRMMGIDDTTYVKFLLIKNELITKRNKFVTFSDVLEHLIEVYNLKQPTVK